MASASAYKSASESFVDIGSYDQDKWNGGGLIAKRTDTSPYWVGPLAVGLARPVETSGAIPGFYPWVMQWSSTIDWVFLADQAAAAATRRVQLYEFNRATSAFAWKGFITITFPTATSYTIRGFRMTYDEYAAGTAAVSGTAVTGTSTLWTDSRLAVGSRIGFGSSDPNAIGTWYQISAIGSNTSITLTSSAGSIGDGPYVIEDLRAVIYTTNATAANGGLNVVKGLQYADFASGGTAIPAATTVDNIKACYWLVDNETTNTDTTAAGLGLRARDSWTQQYCYGLCLPSAGNYKVYKWNLRAALTLTSGKSDDGAVLQTGNATFTGTGSQVNNCRLCTTGHGPASGVEALYFVSTTRFLCAKTSSISAASTTWIDYTGTEIPPGSVNTFAATAALSTVEYSDKIDRFVVVTSGATAFHNYITQFRNDGGQWDHIVMVDDKQIDQSSADATITPHGTTLSLTQTSWSEGGILYTAGVGTTALTNILKCYPIGADWAYAYGESPKQVLISPRMACPSNNKFSRCYVIRDRIIGGDNLGIEASSFKLYYRTTGISDNSGAWTLVADGNDLSGVSGAAEIQFRFDFRCISFNMLPNRIFGVGVVYEDQGTDSHYQPSVANSNISSKIFAWRFSTAFGGTVPTMEVKLYNAVTGALLLTDDTVAAAYGTFGKSTDGGGSWGAYNTSDKANDITYIKYTPTSIADNIRVLAVWRQKA